MFDLDSTLLRLLCKFESFGKYVAQADIYEVKGIKTADTDGVDIRYSPKFVESLKGDEDIFLFAHEILHIILKHIERSVGKDPDVWNIAADAIINAFLVKAGLPMIRGGINIPEAINYDCEEFYEIVLAIKNSMQSENREDGSSAKKDKDFEDVESQGNDSKPIEGEKTIIPESPEENKPEGGKTTSEPGTGVPKSESGSVEDKNEPEKEEQEKSFEDKIKELLRTSHERETPTGIDDHSKWEEAAKNLPPSDGEEISEKDFFKELEREINQSPADYSNQLANEAIYGESGKPGNDPRGANRGVRKIPSATRLVPWQNLLREAARFDEDYADKYKLRNGVFRPKISEVPEYVTEIALDTSASISSQTLMNFLRECRAILDFSIIKVGTFDSKFYGFEEVRSVKDIEKLDLKGGGGTNFDAPIEAFSENASLRIVFTDGQADMPKKRVDAVWVVMGDEKIKPKGGTVINITGKQLDRLINSHLKDQQDDVDFELGE